MRLPHWIRTLLCDTTEAQHPYSDYLSELPDDVIIEHTAFDSQVRPCVPPDLRPNITVGLTESEKNVNRDPRPYMLEWVKSADVLRPVVSGWYAPNIEWALQVFWEGHRCYHTTIRWPRRVKVICAYCGAARDLAVKVSRLERLVETREIPEHLEITWWRVAAASCDEIGETAFERGERATWAWEGRVDDPVILLPGGKKSVCRRCACRIIEIGRSEQLEQMVVFQEDVVKRAGEAPA